MLGKKSTFGKTYQLQFCLTCSLKKKKVLKQDSERVYVCVLGSEGSRVFAGTALVVLTSSMDGYVSDWLQ